ncbi:hypothetical protein CRG98_043429 [Punica granatum]|uniref:Inhibitor I9 domain-containing protein n=1 Tax=Punica granatum TaxID=22663 RepID=A0A2I0HWV3_PUNGR|nr:hypothetical protein CRG98_043429 [Punica granatum]
MSWNVFLFSFSLFLAATMVRGSPDEPARKSYIVYMGDVPEASINAADEHQSLLVNAIGDAHVARSSIIHSYRKSFNGFAARLLPHEVHRLMGIYARAPSFNDHGYGPAPAKWKGTCAKGFNFSGCNKYLSSLQITDK